MSDPLGVPPDTLLRVSGSKSSFRCVCGSNVFRRVPDSFLDSDYFGCVVYECNGCLEWYVSELSEPTGVE